MAYNAVLVVDTGHLFVNHSLKRCLTGGAVSGIRFFRNQDVAFIGCFSIMSTCWTSEAAVLAGFRRVPGRWPQ